MTDLDRPGPQARIRCEFVVIDTAMRGLVGGVSLSLLATCPGIARNRILMQGSAHDALLFSLVPGDLGISQPAGTG